MITDEEKLKEVKNEKHQLDKKLAEITDPATFSLDKLFVFKEDLHSVNLGLWKIEDQIRECEREKDFGAKFIRLARDVYYTNDKRFEIKNAINNLINSDVKEVKSYREY